VGKREALEGRAPHPAAGT